MRPEEWPFTSYACGSSWRRHCWSSAPPWLLMTPMIPLGGGAGFLHGLCVSLLIAAALLLTTALVRLLLRPTPRK
ncbi:hypothetical protein ABZ656_06700 [Streptomyces sp. NPDC007095]|uniref:hypothetical protein n=1 Tax=Streptomyces sp. NPDC007095 TaxID=3154482 RepID=UPI0033FA19E0